MTESILKRINNCNCDICKRANNLPFLYYTCYEIDLAYTVNFDSKKLKDKIQLIKKTYKKNKKLVMLYLYCRYQFYNLYINTSYKPGGYSYFQAMKNFYQMVRTSS